MITATTKQTKSEIAERAWEIYEQRLKPLLEPGQTGKYLVVDVDSGGYEVDMDEVAVMVRAAERFPSGRRFGMRIGHSAMGRIGGNAHSTKPMRLVKP